MLKSAIRIIPAALMTIGVVLYAIAVLTAVVDDPQTRLFGHSASLMSLGIVSHFTWLS